MIVINVVLMFKTNNFIGYYGVKCTLKFFFKECTFKVHAISRDFKLTCACAL